MKFLLVIIFCIYPVHLAAEETTILAHHGISLGDKKDFVLENVEGKLRDKDRCLLMPDEYDGQICPLLIDENLYRINGYNFKRTIQFNRGLVQEIQLHAIKIPRSELIDVHENFNLLAYDFAVAFEEANSKYKKDLVTFTTREREKGKHWGKDCNFEEWTIHRYSYENSVYRMSIIFFYDCNDDDINDSNAVAKVSLHFIMHVDSINQLIEENKAINSEL